MSKERNDKIASILTQCVCSRVCMCICACVYMHKIFGRMCSKMLIVSVCYEITDEFHFFLYSLLFKKFFICNIEKRKPLIFRRMKGTPEFKFCVYYSTFSLQMIFLWG